MDVNGLTNPSLKMNRIHTESPSPFSIITKKEEKGDAIQTKQQKKEVRDRIIKLQKKKKDFVGQNDLQKKQRSNSRVAPYNNKNLVILQSKIDVKSQTYISVLANPHCQ
jgi:hypothetical protein